MDCKVNLCKTCTDEHGLAPTLYSAYMGNAHTYIYIRYMYIHSNRSKNIDFRSMSVFRSYPKMFWICPI